MVLIRLILLLLVAAGAGVSLSPPAAAHENHQKAQEQRAQPTRTSLPPSAMHEQMEDHAEAMEAQEPKTFSERLISWFGRMHPFAVHFPIALFPVALVALIMARKRGETVELIRALIGWPALAPLSRLRLGGSTADSRFAIRTRCSAPPLVRSEADSPRERGGDADRCIAAGWSPRLG